MKTRITAGMVLGALSVLAGTGIAGVERTITSESSPVVFGSDETAIDALLRDLYACISGPAGEPRDWETFDRVFAEDARMAAYFTTAAGESGSIQMTPAEYKERSGPLLVAGGFTESELHRKLEIYGSIAHAFSTYRGTLTNAQGQPQTVEGINSIQLVNAGDGWKVRSLIWQQADEATPIPAVYLPKAQEPAAE